MTPQDAEQIADMLDRRFGGGVDLESVNGNGRYQFAIVSPKFSDLAQLDRQDAVWEIIRTEVEDEVSIDILMVLTLSPEEFAESGGPI